MSIEWKDSPGGATYRPSAYAVVGDLELEAVGARDSNGYIARVLMTFGSDCVPLGCEDVPTLDEAKARCERLAREWIAEQAAALGDGE